jgi:cytochrome oxidase Cu insertion factor (SCO1/SenC/PrrC family)
MKRIFKAAAGLFVLALAVLSLNQCSSANTGAPAEPAIASTKAAPGAVEAAPLKVGDVAPYFTLPDQDGKPVSLSQFRGKKNVVLAFYVLAFTGG